MDSIDEIVHRYSDMLYRLALAKTGNPHDAEDIMQEVFLKLLRHNKPFKDEEHRKAWLIRVTVNTGKNLSLSAAKRKTSGEITESAGAGTDKNLSQLETRMVVYPAVMSLPEIYRVIIHLFYYEDMKITEICRATGLGENTVKSRLYRARGMLKEKLKEVGFDERE